VEAHEKHDDDQARCIAELVNRAKRENLFLSVCYGLSQEPYITTDGDTVEELLPFKHILNAVIGDNQRRIRNYVARFQRWTAVGTSKLLMKNNEFKYSEDKLIVKRRNFAQDIINWGWRHWNDEDNPNS